MVKKFENDNFILYAPDTLDYITDGMEEILNEKLDFYKELFSIDSFRKVQINYFDNIDSFRNFIYDLRGEKDSLPEYAIGTFDKGMINAFIDPNILKGSFLYNKRRCNAAHELFHIMYKELIWQKNKEERIVWFDEGMAQLFSGESDSFLDKEKYEMFVKNEISNTNVIPNLNNLSHGSSFKTADYNGYKLSLIAVKYIYDKLGMNEFKKLLNNSKEIYNYGEIALNEIFKTRRSNMTLYRGTKIAGLKEMEPRLVNHDKPYVYATTDKIEAIIYSVKGGNLNYTNIYGYDDDNKRCLIERKENCLEEIYNVVGRYYIVDDANFEKHDELGVGENEYVSELPVKVIEEITIPNVWKYFKDLEQKGELKIYRYPTRPKSYPNDDSDLIECATMMYTQMGDIDMAFGLLLKHHPELEDKVNIIKEELKNKTNEEILESIKYFK